MTIQETAARIREVMPEWERKVASGEVTIRRPLKYDKKGPSIRGVEGLEGKAEAEAEE